jgi:cytochrome c oxidase subunit II
LKLTYFALLCAALLLVSCLKRDAKPATHIAISMRKFAIEPAVIRIRRGEKVVLDVSTTDVQHGFEVAQLGINEPIQPGRPAEIALDTSKKGEYKVDCSIICGPGHANMSARLIIE